MLSIMSKERRQSKTPLERAAQALDLTQTIASLGNTISGLYGKMSDGGSGSTNEEMFNPERYKLAQMDVLPEKYSTFRVKR